MARKTEAEKKFDEEYKKFFAEEQERAVKGLIEAMKIENALKLILNYIESGFLSPEMTLLEAVEKLDKRKFEVSGITPEDPDENGNPLDPPA